MKIAQPVMQKRQAEIKSKFSSDPKKQQVTARHAKPVKSNPGIQCRANQEKRSQSKSGQGQCCEEFEENGPND